MICAASNRLVFRNVIIKVETTTSSLRVIGLTKLHTLFWQIGVHFSTVWCNVWCLSATSDWKRLVNQTPYIIWHWPQIQSMLVSFQFRPTFAYMYVQTGYTQFGHRQISRLQKCPRVIGRLIGGPYWYRVRHFLHTLNWFCMPFRQASMYCV